MRHRRGQISDFKARLVYRESTRTARDTQSNYCLGRKQINDLKKKKKVKIPVTWVQGGVITDDKPGSGVSSSIVK